MTLGLVKNEVFFLHVTIIGYEMTLLHKGPFTNYVYKRRGVGGQKN